MLETYIVAALIAAASLIPFLVTVACIILIDPLCKFVTDEPQYVAGRWLVFLKSGRTKNGESTTEISAVCEGSSLNHGWVGLVAFAGTLGSAVLTAISSLVGGLPIIWMLVWASSGVLVLYTLRGVYRLRRQVNMNSQYLHEPKEDDKVIETEPVEIWRG